MPVKVVGIQIQQIIGRFVFGKTLDVFVVGGSVLLVEESCPTTHMPLPEEVHLVIDHNIQFDACEPQHGVPNNLRVADEDGRNDLVVFETELAEILKDIGQKGDVRVQVDVVVVPEGFAVKKVPDLFGVLIILRTTRTVGELVEEVLDGL